jgi:putative FmdB family regulatory protein
MPIYEFRCRKCGKRFTVLTLRVSEKAVPHCDKCGSTSADRLMSRFAMPKSEEARLESMADPSALGDLDESDPKSVARWMRKMGKEMGDEAGGEDFDQMVDEIETGGGDESGEGGDLD